MKSANKVFYSVILAKLCAIGLVVFAASSQTKINAPANVENQPAHPFSATPLQLTMNHKQEVTSSADAVMRTVVIAKKRITPDEKQAIGEHLARILQANAQYNKALRKTA